MESSSRITKLCESWWEKLSDSATLEQHQFAGQFLELLGWTNLDSIDPQPAWAHLARTTYVLRAGSTSIAAHFLMPGLLEPPTSVVERHLDFCCTTRLLVNATRSLNVGYIFVTDMHRSFLYDPQTDELLLYADTPDDFNRTFDGVLARTDVELGSLDEVRRQPRSAVARQLREWSHHWSETLMTGTALPKELAFLTIDRLVTLRYLFAHDIVKRLGRGMKKRFSNLLGLAFSASPTGCGKHLTTLFHDVWLDWRAELFAPSPALNEVLENDHITAPLLKEFALLSQTKFSIATVLESFNYGKAAEKARVRLVPDTDEERETYLAKQTCETVDAARITVDVLDEGYRAIFHWFDELVSLYSQLETEYSAKVQNTQPSNDLDLFTWSEIDARRPSALVDRFQHAIEHGLVVYYASQRQYRTARLMLYLHLIGRYAQAKMHFTQFPKIEAALVPRPRVLDSDRKRIFNPVNVDEAE